MKVLNLPVERVFPSPANNRTRFNVTELARSFKEKGQLQAIVVRAKPDSADFEIIAGERRWRAAKKAGFETIRAEVQVMTDAEAHEALLVENMNRENLTPLEEAMGLQAYVDAGYDREAIARSLGISKKRIAALMVLTKLSDLWKTALGEVSEEGDESEKLIPKWTVGHLSEVARVSEDVQEKLFKYYYGKSSIPTISQLQARIGQWTRLLSKAPFPLAIADASQKIPSCQECTQRQGATPDLFGVGVGLAAEKDTCLNGPCYEIKAALYAKGVAATLRQRIKPLPVVLVREEIDEQDRIIAYVGSGERFRSCGKTTRGAIHGIIGKGPRAGQEIYLAKLAETTSAGPVLEVTSSPEEEQANRDKWHRINGIRDALTNQPVHTLDRDALYRMLLIAARVSDRVALKDAIEEVDRGSDDRHLLRSVLLRCLPMQPKENFIDLLDAQLKLSEQAREAA